MALLFTSASDVTKRWIGDDPIPAETATSETRREDAEDAILREFPDGPARRAEDPPTLTVARVQKVAARMVLRVLRNPKGLRTATETEGPYSSNETFAGDRPGEIFLSAQDRADLTATQTGKRAFTVDASPNSAPLADPLAVWGPAYTWGLG